MTARQKRHIVLVLLATTMLASVTWAQNRDDAPDPGEERISALAAFGIGPTEGAPPRAEGEGPFSRLVIRGATLIDGTGAPPRGPVDIVVVNNRISEIRSVGNPGVPIRPEGRPDPGDREIDASGMYVLPGFVDCHAHIATPQHALVGTTPPAEYVYKLWMGHGITTIRENAAGNGLKWTLDQKAKSRANEITAPRMRVHATFPPDGQVSTARAAREWVDDVDRIGADGIKFFGGPPDAVSAAIDEARNNGLRTSMHHAQLAVARMNVLDTAGWGLYSMEHWYGLPEALFVDRAIQDYPLDYNYNDEQDRFGQAGRLWKQAAGPDTERWNEVQQTLVGLDFTLVPTLTIYEASRDLTRAMRAEWHDDYTLPTLWRWFTPNREAHGSYWFYWTTEDEVEWKRNFEIWMAFLNDYKNRGGRVAVGSDAGFIYKVYGFAFVRELELLQEAGFHPLEALRAATLNGAELLGIDNSIGSIEVGKLADMVLVRENPLENFKVLYGTGAIRLNETTNEVERVGGVLYTIKDGIIYDARELLADVREMVAAAKREEADAAVVVPSGN